MGDVTPASCRYTINLQVTVDGPDHDWDRVAGALVLYLGGKRFKVGSKDGPLRFGVVRAEIDTADDDDA